MSKTNTTLQLIRDAAATAVAMVALCAITPAAWADGSSDNDRIHGEGCYSAAVEGIALPTNPEFANNVGGHAKLCVGRSGLTGYMRANHLTEHNAYTVWWVYIDDAECPPGGGFFGCVWTFFGDEPTDFFEVDPLLCGTAIPCIDEPPKAVFGRMDSGISKRWRSLRFANRLDDMRVNPGSQVWMLMFGHGPASDDGLKLGRQLLTPEDPISGYPHLGVDFDGYPVAVAIFEMP